MPRRGRRLERRRLAVSGRWLMIRWMGNNLRAAVAEAPVMRSLADFTRNVVRGLHCTRVLMGLLLELKTTRRLPRRGRLELLLRELTGGGPRRRWVTAALRDGYAAYVLLRRVSRPRSGRAPASGCSQRGVFFPCWFEMLMRGRALASEDVN